MTSFSPILRVRDLRVEFSTYGGTVRAVRGVSFDVYPGETLAIVGESGCGKSVTALALLGLIPSPPGRIVDGTATFLGKDLLGMKDRELQKIRGRELSMIFQDPMTSLNPTMRIGNQIIEVLRQHQRMDRAKARAEALELMELVRIPQARARMGEYPHQFSGGMRQRIIIAIALACRPKILIADEPTTALDVTIQGQILELLGELQRTIDMAVILITHDLAVVASVADRVAVMYAGEIVETGSVDEIFSQPSHPYTQGLQGAVPNPELAREAELVPIPGSPPDLFDPPTGCAFEPRCPLAMEVCASYAPPPFALPRAGETAPGEPVESATERYSACWLHHEAVPEALRSKVTEALRS